MPQNGALIIGGGVDLDLLELAAIRRRGSPHGTRSGMLEVDLLLQSATAEGVSLLMVLTTKFRPLKPRVREEYKTSFMHIFGTNKVPRVVL
jgi:hypothetical protein